jgi:hypothetical protein
MKESIRQLLLLGCKVSISYKRKINEWFSNIEIYALNGLYYVDYKEYDNIEDAINIFCDTAFTSKNVGLIQRRLQDKGVDFEDYNLEYPDAELIKIFEEEGKLLDQEYETLN